MLPEKIQANPDADKLREFADYIFVLNKNSASEIAWACVVYSMVPYLGILFLPFAFIAGVVGYLAVLQRPNLGGEKLSLISLGLAAGIMVIQMFLWWLLYYVPTLNRGM